LLVTKDQYGKTAWHHAAIFGILEALETLWSWGKEAELNPHELLLAKTEEGLTLLHLAAQENHVTILHKLGIRAKESHQNPNELKKKLFLAKDKYGYPAWNQAALFGRLQVLETLWS